MTKYLKVRLDNYGYIVEGKPNFCILIKEDQTEDQAINEYNCLIAYDIAGMRCQCGQHEY